MKIHVKIILIIVLLSGSLLSNYRIGRVEQRCTDAQATYSYWKQKNYQGNSGSNYEDGYFISTIDYPCPSGSYILHSSSKGNHEFIGPYSTIYIYEEATVLGW